MYLRVRTHKSQICRDFYSNFTSLCIDVCFCVYLWRAGQCEQQVKCSFSEVEVVFRSQAKLNSAEH